MSAAVPQRLGTLAPVTQGPNSERQGKVITAGRLYKPFELRALRARKWRGTLHYGPGSSDMHPGWCRGSYWCKPVSRRTMRKRIAEALMDPTLEKIEVWQVPLMLPTHHQKRAAPPLSR